MLKNDFMLIAAWSKENGKDRTFRWIASILFSRLGEHRQAHWASHHWSVLMQSFSLTQAPCPGQAGCLLLGGLEVLFVLKLLLPWDLDYSAAPELFSPFVCIQAQTDYEKTGPGHRQLKAPHPPIYSRLPDHLCLLLYLCSLHVCLACLKSCLLVFIVSWGFCI